MLCCLPPSWVDPKAAYDQQASSNEISSFPGQRRNYVKTAGNALAAAPPAAAPLSPLSSHYPTSPQQQQLNHDTGKKSFDGELISVTVPPGVVGGQTIHVAHPDGSGRLIKAEVPQGSKPGSIFYVKAPPAPSAPAAPSAPPAPSSTATPMPPPAKPSHPVPSQRQSPPMPAAQAFPVYNHSSSIDASPPPFSQCLDDDYDRSRLHHSRYAPTAEDRPSHHATSTTSYAPSAIASGSSGMRLVKVVVPPGSVPGSTIHVQIPGENRLVAAEVPPNCSEFHVQYDPNDEPLTPASSSILNSPPAMHHHAYRPQHQHQQPSQQQSPYPNPYYHQQEYHQQHYQQSQPSASASSSGGKKLLLVQVPSGTAPGTTLHVKIPDEPGRLLSARVPPGNIREFHVSYVPRSAARLFEL